jgi:hypothetical protein
MALTLVATVAIGLAPRAAAHRQTASSQMKLPPVILPTYYDGIETQTVDQTAHPQDPPNTYRVDTHYSLCQQFGGPSDPSQRVNLTDAELAQDGLMPRNAFASIEDWDRSVLNATVRSCDTFQVFNEDGTPVFVNGTPSTHAAKIAGPWLPAQPNRPHTGDNGFDCNCVNHFKTYTPGNPGYAGFVDDGIWTSTPSGLVPTQHVAQYGYSWVPTLTSNGQGNDPVRATDSIWVGSSGLFHGGEILQQTGIEDWYESISGLQTGPFVQPQDELFWECTDPANRNPPPCNIAHEWDGTDPTINKPVHVGDEITMYISGNYHWNEDDAPGNGMVNASNNGPQPALDSSEWIVEDPNCSCGQALANYGHVGIADMQWLNYDNVWRDGSNDTDYIWWTALNSNGTHSLEDMSYGFPQYINSTWNYGISVWWQATN